MESSTLPRLWLTAAILDYVSDGRGALEADVDGLVVTRRCLWRRPGRSRLAAREGADSSPSAAASGTPWPLRFVTGRPHGDDGQTRRKNPATCRPKLVSFRRFLTKKKTQWQPKENSQREQKKTRFVDSIETAAFFFPPIVPYVEKPVLELGNYLFVVDFSQSMDNR